jgi:hypothetical protein
MDGFAYDRSQVEVAFLNASDIKLNRNSFKGFVLFENRVLRPVLDCAISLSAFVALITFPV